METGFHHVPIMVSEVLELLEPARGGIFVDGTLGGGGQYPRRHAATPQSFTVLSMMAWPSITRAQLFSA